MATLSLLPQNAAGFLGAATVTVSVLLAIILSLYIDHFMKFLAGFGCLVFYNLFLHPLRSFPGPWYTRASVLWFIYHSFKGDTPFLLHKIHLEYGPVVRVTPNEISYTDPKAWKDIYGHRNGVPENEKDPSQNFEADSAHPSIIHADKETHSKMRRLLAHAFSDKALREQEPVISQYVRVLIDRLRKAADAGSSVDLVKWYNVSTQNINQKILTHVICLVYYVRRDWTPCTRRVVRLSSELRLPPLDFDDIGNGQIRSLSTRAESRLEHRRSDCAETVGCLHPQVDPGEASEQSAAHAGEIGSAASEQSSLHRPAHQSSKGRE